ncbi:hypothetical protein C1H46_016780 [Malus baccata]|uniref:WAT1-related protein n=1 Tax=Malus baccata TaxID=106549 RepID=A0A540MFT1_MALBA|nr:hypothetical protein C1H46_016780 [Malus baccata]
MQIACIWKEICSSGAVEGLKPVIMMVVAQIAYVGLNIFFKPLADVGMNFAVLIAYRNMFSAAVMIPLALIFERKNSPKLTPSILFQALSGLFGATLAQNIFIESIALTSATFAAAISNIVQAAKMSKNYPFHYSSTALMSIMASIQSVAFALCKERDWSQWKLSWDINLFTAMFGNFGNWIRSDSDGMVCTFTWTVVCVNFQPTVAFAGPLLLDEKLFLGSKEMKMMITQLPQSPSRGFQDPFRTSQSVTIVSTSPVKSSRQNNRDAS